MSTTFTSHWDPRHPSTVIKSWQGTQLVQNREVNCQMKSEQPVRVPRHQSSSWSLFSVHHMTLWTPWFWIGKKKTIKIFFILSSHCSQTLLRSLWVQSFQLCSIFLFLLWNFLQLQENFSIINCIFQSRQSVYQSNLVLHFSVNGYSGF